MLPCGIATPSACLWPEVSMRPADSARLMGITRTLRGRQGGPRARATFLGH